VLPAILPNLDRDADPHSLTRTPLGSLRFLSHILWSFIVRGMKSENSGNSLSRGTAGASNRVKGFPLGRQALAY
jgi:hypothetical protein